MAHATDDSDSESLNLQEASSSQAPHSKRLQGHRNVLTKEQAIHIFMQKKDLDPESLTAASIELSRKYDVSSKAIRDIWYGRTWSEATFHLWQSDDEQVKKFHPSFEEFAQRRKPGRPKGSRDSKPRVKRKEESRTEDHEASAAPQRPIDAEPRHDSFRRTHAMHHTDHNFTPIAPAQLGQESFPLPSASFTSQPSRFSTLQGGLSEQALWTTDATQGSAGMDPWRSSMMPSSMSRLLLPALAADAQRVGVMSIQPSEIRPGSIPMASSTMTLDPMAYSFTSSALPSALPPTLHVPPPGATASLPSSAFPHLASVTGNPWIHYPPLPAATSLWQRAAAPSAAYLGAGGQPPELPWQHQFALGRGFSQGPAAAGMQAAMTGLQPYGGGAAGAAGEHTLRDLGEQGGGGAGIRNLLAGFGQQQP